MDDKAQRLVDDHTKANKLVADFMAAVVGWLDYDLAAGVAPEKAHYAFRLRQIAGDYGKLGDGRGKDVVVERGDEQGNQVIITAGVLESFLRRKYTVRRSRGIEYMKAAVEDLAREIVLMLCRYDAVYRPLGFSWPVAPECEVCGVRRFGGCDRYDCPARIAQHRAIDAEERKQGRKGRR